MADLIQIANLSLSRIGTRSSIADLAEDSPEARGFNTIYEQARDETLDAVDWGFARARRYLADLGKPPPDWQYRYAYPSDCLKIRGLYQPLAQQLGAQEAGNGAVMTMPAVGAAAVADTAMLNTNTPPVPYEAAVDIDAQGNDLKVIYCDQPQALAYFTKRITNTALFPAGFISALTWACGAQLAIPLTGSTALMQACLTQWRLMLSEAATADANEGIHLQMVLPDWILDR
ncbi:MAG TPA: hypothetical protein VM639_01560 [Dongiaceae bacterium]|nr:hypothetical protein [Dongiaceae bacterium]